jgi:hypothetical protein
VVNFSNDGVASDVEKKGCDLLTNGFVLGVWNECVHDKTGKMRAIGKLKDIVCNFFECDLSVWAFGRRMDKLSDLKKGCQKKDKRKGGTGSEAVIELMNKQFVGSKLREGSASETESTERPDVSGEQVGNETERENARLRKRVAQLERKREDEMNLKDALKEVSEEKFVLS